MSSFLSSVVENGAVWGHDFFKRALNYPFGCKISNEKLGEREELVSSLGSVINFIGYVDFLENKVGAARLFAGSIVVWVSPDFHKKMLGGLHAIRGGFEMVGSFEGHLLVLDAFFTLLQTLSSREEVDEGKVLLESDGFFEASFRYLEKLYQESQNNPQKLLGDAKACFQEKLSSLPQAIRNRVLGFDIKKASDRVSSFYEKRKEDAAILLSSGSRALCQVISNPFGLQFRVHEKGVFVLLGGLINFLGYNDFLERKIGVCRLVASIGVLIGAKQEKNKFVALGHLLRAVFEMAGSYEKMLFILDSLVTLYYFANSITEKDVSQKSVEKPA